VNSVSHRRSVLPDLAEWSEPKRAIDMSSAQFSVRWVHKNPVLVTGFVNTAVDWLAVIFQIITDGRILSNPLRSVEPKDMGLETSFEWVDPEIDSRSMDDFWNDILCPAAVSEESDLYYTRSRWLSQFPLWPGPLAISDFRSLLQAPWLSEHFGMKSVVIVPNGRMFVSDMYARRKENRSVIRLENLEPLVRKHPEFCPVDFDELVDQPHTTGKFAAVYAILNKWFEHEAKVNDYVLLFPYDALARKAHESVDHLADLLDLRRRNKVSEALKAVRISYNGFNYQKIPHSPKDPEGWRTSLHPGQVRIIDDILDRMQCSVDGVASWSPSVEQIRKYEAAEALERSRRRRRSGADETPVPLEVPQEETEQEHDSGIAYRSESRRERRSSRSGESSSTSSGRESSRGGSSSRGGGSSRGDVSSRGDSSKRRSESSSRRRERRGDRESRPDDSSED